MSVEPSTGSLSGRNSEIRLICSEKLLEQTNAPRIGPVAQAQRAVFTAKLAIAVASLIRPGRWLGARCFRFERPMPRSGTQVAATAALLLCQSLAGETNVALRITFFPVESPEYFFFVTIRTSPRLSRQCLLPSLSSRMITIRINTPT